MVIFSKNIKLENINKKIYIFEEMVISLLCEKLVGELACDSKMPPTTRTENEQINLMFMIFIFLGP